MEEQNMASPFGEAGVPENPTNVNEQLQGIVDADVQPQSVSNETQEAVVEYAGFWARVAAVLVDGLVLAIPSAVLQGILGKGPGSIIGMMFAWVYAIYMLNTQQATLGKMAVGLKVTTTDGGKPTVGKLVLREIIGKILNIITLYIGYIMVAFTEKKRGLHDIIADTVVIYDPARKRRNWLIVLGIVFTFIIPIVGIIAGIVLVSTNSARQRVLDAKNQAVQRNIELQKQVDAQAK